MPNYMLIDAPPATEPLGLSVAVGAGVYDVTPDDPRWISGFTLVGEACNGPDAIYTLDPTCSPTTTAKASASGWPGFEANQDHRPIVIGAGVKCSPAGHTDLAEWHAKADRRLELCEWYEIAFELWTGEQSKAKGFGNRYLASPDVTVLAGGDELSLLSAIAEIEQAFPTCTCDGTKLIHMPKWLLDVAKAKTIIERRGERWFTAAGALIVADDGYPGTGPDVLDEDDDVVAGPDLEEDQVWLFGTTAVSVARSKAVTHPEPNWDTAISYRTNDVEVRSEKWAGATWLCCHFGVLATIGA